MSSAVEKIKERLSVNEVLGSYLKLEKAGINFKAKCPFHNEKTPSFFISPGRGSFYCFGCGAKGDIFSFVEKFEGLDFKGALKLLADRAGISLDEFRDNSVFEKQKKDILRALEVATTFFEGEFQKNKSAQEYLSGRGLEEGMIKKWRIGYAPLEWRTLKAYLASEGIFESVMIQAGLIKKSGEAKDFYDVFRGRVMFPIFDTVGRVIAFSGRILVPEENAPKYLNSPETVLFNKSETLYGLHEAKIAIRKKGYSILVEGQMDLLMCHQAGFDNTIATSGTAFTAEHAKRLKSLSPKIIMIFDGDSAGFKAAGRSAELALSLGMDVKFGALPEGVDPADLIAKDKKAWRDVVANSKHIVDFNLEHLFAQSLPPRKLIQALEATVLPLIRKLPSELEKAHFIGKIRDIANLPEEALWHELKKVPPAPKDTAIPSRLAAAPSIARKTTFFDPLLAIYFSLEQKEKESKEVKIIIEFLTHLMGKEREESLLTEALLRKDELIFDFERAHPEGMHKGELETILESVRRLFLKQEREKVTVEIRKAEMAGDSKQVEALKSRYHDLMKQK